MTKITIWETGHREPATLPKEPAKDNWLFKLEIVADFAPVNRNFHGNPLTKESPRPTDFTLALS